ncbi:hypothetical protein Bcav_1425 [Beutenbergia cavernae DSM 12333]|uniref:Uncharacterized protein n=1 Tax=Beutenbergia cavernae (strain ATCC BAA-8 / DSM 12333 / CCUG 43141 / JCM 11478 / NBRC 16432 / NCIMB 13614 / HKI 0122) TaxID=471853 RepID=C5C2J7_BEUC1|nr:hypothetical protein [Beutenbergia cavernae]ACQ79683.1 hypothetical protein Bcav_1425 [Beutenbergia cavernae DSM 12333]
MAAWFRRRRAEREDRPEAPDAVAEESVAAPEREPIPLALPDVAPEEEATSSAEYAEPELVLGTAPSETVADVSWSDGAGAVVVGIVHAGEPGADEAAADAVRAAIEQGLTRAVSEDVLATVPGSAREDYPVIVSVRIAEDAAGEGVHAMLSGARKQFARGGRVRLVVDAVPRDELRG